MTQFMRLASSCRLSEHLVRIPSICKFGFNLGHLTSPRTPIVLSQRGIFDKSFICNELQADKRQEFIKSFSHGRPKDKVIAEISDILRNDPTRLAHTLDLRLLASVAEDRADFEVIEEFITKTHGWFEDKKTLHYKIILMRSLYFSGDPDRAYNWIKDTQKYGNFFQAYEVYRIAMIILYDAGRYDDVVELFDLFIERGLSGPDEIPNSMQWITCASLAKICSPKALEKMKEICRIDSEELSYHCCKFLSFIAIENGESSLAIYITNRFNYTTAVSMINLELLAFTKLERYNMLISRLRQMIDNLKRPFLSRELFDLLRLNLYDIADEAIRDKLDRELQYISKFRMIVEEDIETIVFKKIQGKIAKDEIKRDDTRRNRRYRGSSDIDEPME